MVLKEEQGALFYKSWFSLLKYANYKYDIVDDFTEATHSEGISLEKTYKVANRIWDDVSIIDEYLEMFSDKMSEEERDIVVRWKNVVRGTFIVDRHLKKGSILISEKKKVYLVKGIYSSWREMLGDLPTPQMVNAALIPFQGEIICDGLIHPYGVCLDKNLSDESKRIYMEAKASNKIYTCI